MNAERWRQIQALFERALERPAAERAAFLEEACADDGALLDEVTTLLASHAEAEREGGSPAPGAWLQSAVPLAGGGDAPLDRIGPYRIVREIGAGGMGRVYLAERDDTDDPEFRQRVALKLARADLAVPRLEERFLRERRVLAHLEHPNIARLLDGGTSADGRPYFVMEYVDGRAIDAYCDAERLEVDRCLALFLEVCAAVHHAHTHLVVHRDLKASNILVTEEAQVKLLDFGIAKLLEPETGEGLTARTQTGTAWMTPDYASPEQVKGGAVTTATDVYSLGVLLYRLLGGRAPYQLAGKSASEIERTICETDPARPSTAVGPDTATLRRSTPERLRARLAGDLDTIVLKAMHKDPAKRYGSAAEFADDIDRHRRRLPVRARPDTAAYRIRRFVARHRVPVVAGALVVLALVAGVLGTAWQAQTAERERDRAQLETAKAERAATFLADLFKVAEGDELPGDKVTALELLDRGADRVRRELADQPEVRANMMAVTAGVYRNLGFFDRARSLAEEAYEIRKRELDPADPQVAASANELAVILQELGEFKAAEAMAREALAFSRALPRPDPATETSALGNIATALHSQRELDAAEPYYRESLSRRRAAFGPDDPAIATDATNLAALLSMRGAHAEADSLLRESIRILTARFGPEALEVSHALNNLGTSLIRSARSEEAEAVLERALAIRERALGADHPEVGKTLNNLATALENQDKFAQAETHYRRALAIKQARLGHDHASIAISLNNLAGCLRKMGRYDEAAALFEESVAIRRKAYGEHHPRVATALGNLALVYEARGDRAGAVRCWREVLQIQRKERGAESPEAQQAEEALARLASGKG